MSTEGISADASSTPEFNPALTASLEAALGNQVPGILSQISRRFSVDQIKAKSGTIGDLDIDKIVLGDATIENIILTNTDAKLKGAQAFMEDVRSVLELRFTLDWEIDLGWLGGWDGHENLGSLDFGMELGNVSVPSLADIDMHIPSIKVPGVSLAMRPIHNLDLGGAQFRKMEVSNTDAPANGFSMTGIGVGSITVQNVDIPATTTEKITLQEFSPNQHVTLPGAEVTNIEIPAASVDNIRTGGFNLSAIASKRCLDIDLGILELNFCVEPVVHMDIGAMTIHDAELSAMASKLEVDNITIPMTMRGIAMKNLALNSIKINKISL